MKRILLIDGDVLVYKTAFAAEKVIDWGGGLVTLHSNTDEAAQTIDAQITMIATQLKADEVVVALTCHETPNFRKEFYPQYKANRGEKRKPIIWKAMREHLMENHDAKIKSNLEADDVLGILSTMPHKGQERIIVSVDKDFKTIPGLFFNMKDGKSGEVQTITEDEADFNFMLQTLMGDATDNYPGCPGIGAKRADLLLDLAIKSNAGLPEPKSRLEAMWSEVVKVFAKAGFGEEYALNQARCARILRFSDYDTKVKSPILWSPPCS